MISQIRTFQDSSGEVRISRIDSYLWMRQSGIYFQAKRNGYRNNVGICTYCSDEMPQIMDTEGGLARCVCHLLDEERYLVEAQELASSHQPRKMSSFEIWGDVKSKDALVIAMAAVNGWIESPGRWMVIAGGFGTGKTFLLHAINTIFKPWSLYISVPDFEQLIFKYTGEGDLDRVIDIIATHPILLLDDVGADYGSKYPISMLRRVIDFRYRRWWEYPTIVTTNLSPLQLEQYDGRTADRLLDKEVSQVVSMAQVKSWRRNGK